jgi:PAS domain S-box-containing protein
VEKDIEHLNFKISELSAELITTRAIIKQKDHLEQEYERSQNRFKTVFDESSLGNKFINSDLRIIKVNKSLVKLLGYGEAELIGSRITDYAHPDFVPHWKKLQHNLWTLQQPSFKIDVCMIKKDKSKVWCHVTSILFEDKNEILGYTIMENITKRKQLEINLELANNKQMLFQQELLKNTVKTQEEERARIAGNLHNSLGQLLYSVKLNLELIDLKSFDHKNEDASAIVRAKKLLDECVKETRNISHDLMPSILDGFGLKDAIQDICTQLSYKTSFHFEFSGSGYKVSKSLEMTIFRIVQELMMNVIKHADAQKADLEIEVDDNKVLIKLKDYGKGFDTEKLKKPGIGVRSIRNKITILNGKFDISSKPQQGTMVTIKLPVTAL